MPLSPPLTPNRPTRGPGSNLVSTSDDHGTPYETGYSTQRTGGPGNVISSKSQEEQAKDRRGTFGEGQASNSGVVQARQYSKTELENLERQEEIAGSGGSCGAEVFHKWQEDEKAAGHIPQRRG